MEHMLLEELNRMFQQGTCDLKAAAKRLQVPLWVIQRTFADGLLKGYWKVSDGQLLINCRPTMPENFHRPNRLGAVPITWSPRSMANTYWVLVYITQRTSRETRPQRNPSPKAGVLLTLGPIEHRCS